MNPPPALTFAALDGLAFAAARNRLGALPAGTVYAGSALAPFLEFSQLARGGLLPRPGDAPWFLPGGMTALETALRSGHKQWVCPDGASAGFFRMGAVWSEDDTPWMGFQLAAQKAAAPPRSSRRRSARCSATCTSIPARRLPASPLSWRIVMRSSSPSPIAASVSGRAFARVPTMLTSPTTGRRCVLR
jgi:hypothetical protein